MDMNTNTTVSWEQEKRELYRRIEQLENESDHYRRESDRLRMLENQYRTMADGTPAIIWVTDAQGKMIFVNRAYCEFFGVTLEQVQTEGWQPLVYSEDTERYTQEFVNCLREKWEFRARGRVLRQDGVWRWVDSYGQPRCAENGDFQGMVGSSLDITERMNVEEALQESEKQYRELVQYAPTGIYELDFRTNRFLSVNDTICQITGYSREELLSMSPFELLDEPSRQVFKSRIKEWLAGGKLDQSVEYKVITKDGRGIYAVLSVTFTRDAKGQPLGATVIAHDITDRKRMEEALENIARFPIENPDPVMRITAEGEILFSNPASQIIFRFWKKTGQPRLPENVVSLGAECLESGKDAQVEVKVGKKIYSLSLIPLQDREYINIYGRDITFRKKMDAVLRESETRFRAMADGTPVLMWVTKADGSLDFANRAYLEFFGVTLEQLQASGWQPLVHPEDNQRYIQSFLTCFNERRVFRAQGRVRRYDGAWRWLDSIGQPRFSGSGEFLGMVGSSSDITEQLEAEKALRASEEKYRELVQYANSAIIRWDREGNICFFNDYAKQFFGYTEEEITGKKVDVLVPPTETGGSDLTTLVRDILDHPEQYQRNVNENIRADGNRVWMAWTNRPVYDENGEIQEVLAVGSDITEQKHLEQALLDYNHRLEQSNQDLERFAFIASHDLQEPLRKINSFGERIMSRIGDQIDDESKVFLERMQDASQRMQKMIDGLLELSRVTTRGQPFVMVDLNHVAEAVLSDLENRIHASGGEVKIGELPEVMADPVQMNQLLQNLLFNALKFQKEGTPPRVEIYSKMDLPIDDLRRGQVRIYVRDNGIGFDEQYLQRIFQPFERLVGRSAYEGSGIGLAICKKIVERHGGTITATSKPGAGSTFIVTLPLG